VEANFGDNPKKPFEYDIKKCPGMGLEWIWVKNVWNLNQ
jgi:hypothetical protein